LNTGGVQRTLKKLDKIWFWHERIHGQQFFGIPLRKDLDGHGGPL
jgi:hypothetical protein